MIDYEEDVEVSNDQLAEIAELALQQHNLENDIEAEKAKLKILVDQHKKISTDTLPTAMQAAGMSSFALVNGSEVKVKEELFMSLPKKNKAEASQWMIDNDHEALVKTDVYLPFNKGETVELNALVNILEDAGYGEKYSVDQNMNTSSAKAAIREMLEAGIDVPMKLFGAFQQTTAKIKLPK